MHKLIQKFFYKFYAPLLLALDIFSFYLIYHAAIFIRSFHSNIEAYYSEAFLISILILFMMYYLISGYQRTKEKTTLIYASEHFVASGVSLFLSLSFIYAIALYGDPGSKPSRLSVFLTFIAFSFISFYYRRALSLYLKGFSVSQTFILIGCGKAALHFYESYRSMKMVEKLRIFDPIGSRAEKPLSGEGSPIVEHLSFDAFNQGKVQGKHLESFRGVILAEHLPLIQKNFLDLALMDEKNQVPLYTLESFENIFWKRLALGSLDPTWVVEGNASSFLRDGVFNKIKRLFDLLAASLGIILSLPFILIFALLIKLDSKGRIFFKQERVGQYKKPFMLYKLRTMTEQKGGDIYTRKDDPRVTRIGRYLRKLRIDEIPQLWNILKGDMSLIGPRAEWIKCVDAYEKNIPFYHLRHLVKPGITGWAQVNYPYGESEKDARNKLAYDLYYIKNYSFILDASVILKTIHTVLLIKGR